MAVCSAGCLSGCLTGWLAVCIFMYLAGCFSLSGWLFGQLPDWLALCLADFLSVCSCLTASLCMSSWLPEIVKIFPVSLPATATKCEGPLKFLCKNGECIDSAKVCDNVKDCKDRSDEPKKECGKDTCTHTHTGTHIVNALFELFESTNHITVKGFKHLKEVYFVLLCL